MRERGGKVHRYNSEVLVAYIPSVQKSNNIIKYMESTNIKIVHICEYSDGKRHTFPRV